MGVLTQVRTRMTSARARKVGDEACVTALDPPLAEALNALSRRDGRIVLELVRRLYALEQEHGVDYAEAALEGLLNAVRNERRGLS